MPSFSKKSRERLDTCDPRLVHLFEVVIQTDDCSIEGGARTMDEQAANILKGVSKTKDSKHVVNDVTPFSRAVDAAPYPVVWPVPGSETYVHDIGRFYYFAGRVKLIAKQLGYSIRWGGDWDGDTDFRDQTFDDLDHFELVED